MHLGCIAMAAVSEPVPRRVSKIVTFNALYRTAVAFAMMAMHEKNRLHYVFQLRTVRYVYAKFSLFVDFVIYQLFFYRLALCSKVKNAVDTNPGWTIMVAVNEHAIRRTSTIAIENAFDRKAVVFAITDMYGKMANAYRGATAITIIKFEVASVSYLLAFLLTILL